MSKKQIAATVLIPTFDHGSLLRYSVQSVLDQTIKNIEVFVVGDGPPDITRSIMTDFALKDPRVRFFDNPKGPRHGEIYRHKALQKARGKIICYLSDDDLYLPNHVEHMLGLLKDHDLANVLPFNISANQSLRIGVVDLADDFYKKDILGGISRLSLSHFAHTLKAYRNLPHGWRTTPEGTYTDHYMVKQFLANKKIRGVSSSHPTVLAFPSPERKNWSVAARLKEMGVWYKKIREQSFLVDFLQDVLRALNKQRSDEYKVLMNETVQYTALAAQLKDQQIVLTQMEGQQIALIQQIQNMENSPFWRLRLKVLKIPKLSAAYYRFVEKPKSTRKKHR